MLSLDFALTLWDRISVYVAASSSYSSHQRLTHHLLMVLWNISTLQLKMSLLKGFRLIIMPLSHGIQKDFGVMTHSYLTDSLIYQHLKYQLWPDRFYHSSMDRPEQMSDNTLGRAGAIVGTYLYLLATAGAKEAIWFAGLAARDWKRRISHIFSG